MKKSVLALFTIAAVSLTSGCANHISTETDISRSIDRQIIANDLEINAFQNPKSMEQLKVEVKQNIAYTVKENEKTIHFDISTPYQPARELYEPFVGIIAIAGGVVVNVLDFALLGLLPNNLTDAPLQFGFAGLNPLMNIESKTRIKRKELTTEINELDSREEFISKPYVGEIVLKADQDTFTAQADHRGNSTFNLSDVFAKNGTNYMNFEVSVQAEDISAVKPVYIDRKSMSHISKLAEVLRKYESEEPVNVADAASDIRTIAEMGFSDKSHALELEIRNKLDSAQQQELSQAIINLYL